MRDGLEGGLLAGAGQGASAYTGGMARIRRQTQGQPVVVVLTDLDRELLAQAFDAYVYTSGKSAAKVAQELGVARPYLYRLISAEHIEVERLIRLQDLLGVYLLSEREVEDYVDGLRSEILGRPLGESCFEGAPTIRVSLYYVKEYLLDDLAAELEDNERLGNEWRERRATIEFAWEDSRYHLRKLYQHCSSIIESLEVGSLDIDCMEDDRETHHEVNVYLPVVGVSDYWADFEERIADQIVSTYADLSRDAWDHESDGPPDEDKMVPWAKDSMDREIAYHEDFCGKMLSKITELESEVERIELLCETRERALRRTSYRLSELHDIAENLEANSFLLTPKHKKSIAEWLAANQPGLQLVSEDNWWARKSEFRCMKCGNVYFANFRHVAVGGTCPFCAMPSRKGMST
jgi:hypothetical protein